jgi:sigma-B regulation protein RsbU (phosphoserine phosphatase)
LLYQNTADDKFVTFFIGELNYNNSSLTYINAGHNPPIFISNSEVLELNKGCLPLGIEQELNDIEIGNIIFQQGDLLAIFTDGIVEATSSEGVEFGKDKLIENLIRYIDSSAKEISEKLLNELINFTKYKNKEKGEMNFQDDITLNIIKRK